MRTGQRMRFAMVWAMSVAAAAGLVLPGVAEANVRGTQWQAVAGVKFKGHPKHDVYVTARFGPSTANNLDFSRFEILKQLPPMPVCFIGDYTQNDSTGDLTFTPDTASLQTFIMHHIEELAADEGDTRVTDEVQITNVNGTGKSRFDNQAFALRLTYDLKVDFTWRGQLNGADDQFDSDFSFNINDSLGNELAPLGDDDDDDDDSGVVDTFAGAQYDLDVSHKINVKKAGKHKGEVDYGIAFGPANGLGMGQYALGMPGQATFTGDYEFDAKKERAYLTLPFDQLQQVVTDMLGDHFPQIGSPDNFQFDVKKAEFRVKNDKPDLQIIAKADYTGFIDGEFSDNLKINFAIDGGPDMGVVGDDDDDDSFPGDDDDDASGPTTLAGTMWTVEVVTDFKPTGKTTLVDSSYSRQYVLVFGPYIDINLDPGTYWLGSPGKDAIFTGGFSFNARNGKVEFDVPQLQATAKIERVVGFQPLEVEDLAVNIDKVKADGKLKDGELEFGFDLKGNLSYEIDGTPEDGGFKYEFAGQSVNDDTPSVSDQEFVVEVKRKLKIKKIGNNTAEDTLDVEFGLDGSPAEGNFSVVGSGAGSAFTGDYTGRQKVTFQLSDDDAKQMVIDALFEAQGGPVQVEVEVTNVMAMGFLNPLGIFEILVEISFDIEASVGGDTIETEGTYQIKGKSKPTL